MCEIGRQLGFVNKLMIELGSVELPITPTRVKLSDNETMADDGTDNGERAREWKEFRANKDMEYTAVYNVEIGKIGSCDSIISGGCVGRHKTALCDCDRVCNS